MQISHENVLGDRKAGFSFIQYRDFPAAAKAIKDLNLTKVKGRPVAIDWAVPKDEYMTAVHDESMLINTVQ